MADKTPVRVVFNSDNVATGMAEFQSGESIAVANGGTGLTAVGSAGQVLKVNAAGSGLEFGAEGDISITNLVAPTNSDLTLTTSGTGNIVLDAITFRGTTISSADSTTININDNVEIDGNLVVTGTVDFNDQNISNVGSLSIDSISGDADTNTSITFSGSDVITIATGGSGRLTIGDGALSPVTDNQIDLGTSSLEFKDAFFDGTVTTDALTVSGTSSLADVTMSTSLALASGATVTGIADEDNMSSNSATLLATQQSVKAYVDTEIGNISTTSIVQNNSNITVADSGTGTITVTVDGSAIGDFTSAGLQLGGSGARVTTVLDEDAMGTNSATALATQQSIKAYVDSTVTAQDLDITADDSTALSIDLDSDTLHFAGGTGITTTVSGKTVSHAIDGTVATLAGSQILTNKSIDFDNNTVTNIEVDNLKSGVLDTDINSVAGTDTTLASAKAIKTYVDAQVTLQDLDVQGDSGTIDIDLDSETLDIAGGTNITTAGAGTTITVNLDTALTGLTSVAVDNITISDNSITTNASNANLELSANGTGVVKIDGGIDIGDANISFGTATTTSSSAANMDTFTAATFRSAKYQVSIVDSTNTKFGIYEVFVTHDGSSAFINAQGISDTGLDLATFSADIDSGSVRVRVVPISDASTVFKFVRTVFAV